MKRFLRIIGALGGAVLSVGAMIAISPLASASHDVYPPGWNQPVTKVPQPSLNFRAGCGWDDSQRYWPDQNGCGAPKSHTMTYGPVIYQMNPQGERYHRVD